MKKLSLYLALLTCMVFHAGDAMARRAQVVFDATLTATCAPWDGEALDIVVEMPASHEKFTATLWRQGLDRSQSWQTSDAETRWRNEHG